MLSSRKIHIAVIVALLNLQLGQLNGQEMESQVGSAQSAPARLGWPRTFEAPGGAELVVYQPQIVRWVDQEKLRARLALALSKPGSSDRELGTLILDADTETDLESNLVRVFNLEILEGTFADLSDNASKIMVERVKGFFPKEFIMSFDRILAGVSEGKVAQRLVELSSNPPPIFVSQTAAILVQFDGEPLLKPIEGTGLEYAVNTNWELILSTKKRVFYLRYGDSWLRAPEIDGPWVSARKLPKDLDKLAAESENWGDVVANISGRGRSSKKAPRVFVTLEPAELVLIDGPPESKSIPGTDLEWVTNTESDLFRYLPDGSFFYLVSGRWFKTGSLEDSWEFASNALPDDFAKIPLDHPKDSVLASVPGTQQAVQSVVRAQFPYRAVIDRQNVAAPPVLFIGGEPEWTPIEGTALAYASNTDRDVIRLAESYLLCVDGVWFGSAEPGGPWKVADTVPEEIYQIPPGSPMFRTSFVRVYDSTPTTVSVGYTSGYRGVYFGWGGSVFGTGWYNAPSTRWGTDSAYYFWYPFSFGTGAKYNPHTGTYGRGSTGYGPYGGIGRGAVLDSSSESFSRASAVWGPDTEGAWSEAFSSPSDNRTAARHDLNVYANWSSEAATLGYDWARTFEGSTAGEQSYVVSEEDNFFAGLDGRVYRHDDGIWTKQENGEWSELRTPKERPKSTGSVQLSGEEARAAVREFQVRRTYGQINRDLEKRSMGSARVEQHLEWIRDHD